VSINNEHYILNSNRSNRITAFGNAFHLSTRFLVPLVTIFLL